jgi:hypothetical protein
VKLSNINFSKEFGAQKGSMMTLKSGSLADDARQNPGQRSPQRHKDTKYNYDSEKYTELSYAF